MAYNGLPAEYPSSGATSMRMDIDPTDTFKTSLLSSAHMRLNSCMDFERSQHMSTVQTHTEDVIEHGHVTTFDILTRAASTLAHPTSWASNMLSLVTASTSAAVSGSTAPESSGSTSSDTDEAVVETISGPATTSSFSVPLVTCIIPPVLTLTEPCGPADVTMTRRLSLSELSRPPYAPWPPRESRTVLCANAAAHTSRVIARGEPDPLRFMLPWVMDKRNIFPLPLDHQGRASFRSGRWWSRRNLGYEYYRPAPVKFVMRKKGSVSAQDEISPLNAQAEPEYTDVGDETLPLACGRHAPEPPSLEATSLMTIREAALAMARAGQERRQSIPPSHAAHAVLAPVLLHAARSNSDAAFPHFTDSDSEGEEELSRRAAQAQMQAEEPALPRLHLRQPTARRAYSTKRLPSIRGRSSSLHKVVISADDAQPDETQPPADVSVDDAAPEQRRLFAQRWHNPTAVTNNPQTHTHSRSGSFARSLDSLSQDSDDSDDSLGRRFVDCSSDTSEEDSDSDDLDTQISRALVGGKHEGKMRHQLLGTVLEDEIEEELGVAAEDDSEAEVEAAVAADEPLPPPFRHASFFLADSPDEELGDAFELVPPLSLLHRTQVLEHLQAAHKIPHVHSAAGLASSAPAACGEQQQQQQDGEGEETSCFAAAVRARPVPTVQMPGKGGPVTPRPAQKPLPARPASRTVYLEMDWEP